MNSTEYTRLKPIPQLNGIQSFETGSLHGEKLRVVTYVENPTLYLLDSFTEKANTTISKSFGNLSSQFSTMIDSLKIKARNNTDLKGSNSDLDFQSFSPEDLEDAVEIDD